MMVSRAQFCHLRIRHSLDRMILVSTAVLTMPQTESQDESSAQYSMALIRLSALDVEDVKSPLRL
jgi:hypothetical protein